MADPLEKMMAGPPSEPSSGGMGSSELDAAKDLIAAVKRGDAKAASLALKRHYEACQDTQEPDSDEDDYEET